MSDFEDTGTWMKIFRIIPEFRILRLTFWKVSLKMLNKANYNSFSDVFSVCLKTIDALNLKLFLVCMHAACFKF